MATYHEIRYCVTEEAPSVAPALIDGYLLDRYTAILDRLKWTRRTGALGFTTTAPYATGQFTLTAGQSSVILTGGVFDTTMTGRILRPEGDDDYYEFTFVDGATATLDRPMREKPGRTRVGPHINPADGSSASHARCPS